MSLVRPEAGDEIAAEAAILEEAAPARAARPGAGVWTLAWPAIAANLLPRGSWRSGSPNGRRQV